MSENVYNSFSDEELASRLKLGDKEAFATIYDRFKGVLFIHALRILQEKEEARDILQEIFTRLWTKRETIVFSFGLSAYLYASVRNGVFDILAHRKVERSYMTSLSDFVEADKYETDHLIRERELTVMIEREIAALPPKMREVFEMSRKAHLSHREIAEELGISEKTVKKQVNNALKVLRSKLGIYAFLFF